MLVGEKATNEQANKIESKEPCKRLTGHSRVCAISECPVHQFE